MPETIRCRCPFCGYRWEALKPANLALFKRCPNPNLLPGDTSGQRKAGGRLCRGDLSHVVFTLDANGSWGAPP
jgi:hypothetical protein